MTGGTRNFCLFLGQMHFYQKNWDQAAHYYQEYLTQVPQDAAARQQLAQALSYAPGRLAEAASEYENTAKMTGDPQLRLQKAAVLLQLAQDASDDPRQHDQAPAKWTAASAALQQLPGRGLAPRAPPGTSTPAPLAGRTGAGPGSAGQISGSSPPGPAGPAGPGPHPHLSPTRDRSRRNSAPAAPGKIISRLSWKSRLLLDSILRHLKSFPGQTRSDPLMLE